MDNIQKLMTAETPYLTDGGFETWMFFVEGFEAPEFAALMLMDDPAAQQAMRRYFDRFLAMASANQVGFVLDTNTWRGCTKWASKLDTTPDNLLRLSRDATSFAKAIKDGWGSKVPSIILNGVIGPSGDGYIVEESLDVETAEILHRPQVEVLVEAGVEMISALTITNTAEAIGITRAATKAKVPVVISYTLETNGKLPTGETLGDAIMKTDIATDSAPLYYMINCAHPEHFLDVFGPGNDWLSRIGGVRANASRMSHAELDGSETLDEGNPAEFGSLHAEIHRLLPNLRVVGGCCGTDHRHVSCVTDHIHRKLAA